METLTELTSKELINLWSQSCQRFLPIDRYCEEGSIKSPVYSIKISDSVSLVISLEDKCYIRLVFGGYLTYKKFEISLEDFKLMTSEHEASIKEKQAQINKELIEKGENELSTLLV